MLKRPPQRHSENQTFGIMPVRLGHFLLRKSLDAYCGDTDHGGRHTCRKTRSCRRSRSVMSGRPVEHRAAWLLKHDKALTAEDRRICLAAPDLEARQSARQMVKQVPGGLDLLCCERHGERDVDGKTRFRRASHESFIFSRRCIRDLNATVCALRNAHEKCIEYHSITQSPISMSCANVEST